MKIEVYAVLKDHFEPCFTMTSQMNSIAALRQELIMQQPVAAAILKASRFAVNNQMVSDDYKLTDNDTIAVLPPASGG